MSHGVDPSRPQPRLTPDGRRMREVLTYARRGSRLTDGQQQAWDRRHAEWWVPSAVADEPGYDLRSAFGRDAPLVVEIGSGVGETTAALAAAYPEWNVLAFEVWLPGVAQTMLRLEQVGADNARLCSLDAVWAFEHLLADESLAELWTFFPDPWPKARHHKRRLVQPAFAAVAARRLEVGAAWRLATDWPEYADAMRAVLDDEPRLTGGEVERWSERPLTRFERRGLEAGRPITDLCYRREA